MKLGLLDAFEKEVRYPGYERQDVDCRPCTQGYVQLNGIVAFPVVGPFPATLVKFLGLYRGDEMLPIAVIPIGQGLVVSEGITPTATMGDLQVAIGHMGLDPFWKAPAAKLPTNCKKCNHYNEYVGLEHLTAGEYICRSCKR